MGTAILSGLLKAGFAASSVSVSTKSQASASRLAAELGVTAAATETTIDANVVAVANADVILVAVKPAYVVSVLQEAAEAIKPGALVVSVAAGITIAAMEAALPETVAVVRSMPNTPAIVGRAVTGLALGDRVTEAQRLQAVSLFETVGKVVELPESQIDELSTVSGSGPAYVFYLIEEFTKAAQGMGFSEATARLLVEETFLGASELLAHSGKSPQELRKQVTSPNGTTMRAVAKLEEANLTRLFADATAAALARAKEIAAGLG